MRQSQASVTSKPPPMHAPWMAAIFGILSRASRSNTAWPSQMRSFTRMGHAADGLEVRPSHKDAIFAAAKHERLHAGVVLKGLEVMIELAQRFLIPDVGGGLR
jgi:hypothetical protein